MSMGFEKEVVYPESDGEPMAENTLQFTYIVLIKEGLNILYKHRDDVFVAGDLFWYHVEGDPNERAAPDTMVVFGRPRREYLGSYKQWEEENIAPQVVFEVLSPSNTPAGMRQKLNFYDRHGTQEYYVYDPLGGTLEGHQREAGHLTPIEQMQGWISPLMNVRFELQGQDLRLYGPDGTPFRTPTELDDLRERAEQLAIEEKQQREQAEQLADEEKQQRERAEQLAKEEKQQRERAEAEAEQEKQQRQDAESKAQKAELQIQQLLAKLQEHGIDPEEP